MAEEAYVLRTHDAPATPATGAEEPPPIAQAMVQWLMGDWHALAALAKEQVAAHPGRDRLALLAACAHQQLDQHELARTWLRQSLSWGCHPGLAARLLLSGVHNTLGRIAALRSDDVAVTGHFAEAMRITGDPQASAASHARAVREMGSLGLLPQAADLIAHQAAALTQQRLRPMVLEQRLQALSSDIDALKRTTQEGASPGLSVTDVTPAALEWDQLARMASHPDGDDLWILRRTGSMTGGTFIEFASARVVTTSPTYLLERLFAWTGLLLVRDPRLLHAFRRQRRCQVHTLVPATSTSTSIAAAHDMVRQGLAAEDVHLLVLDHAETQSLGIGAVEPLRQWRPRHVLVPRPHADLAHRPLALAGYVPDVDAPWRFERSR